MEESTSTKPRSIFARIFLSPGERRLRSGWRILGQLLLLAIFFLAFGGLIGLITFLLGTPSGLGVLFIGQFVLFLAITFSVYLARRFLDRRTFVSLGLSWDSRAIRDLLFGIFLAGLMMGLIYLVEWALGWLTFGGYAWQEGSASQLIIGLGAMFLVFIIVGWQEELIGRGYWLQNMEQGLNLFWAVLISSSFFALAHLGNPNVTWVAILGLVLAGGFLAYGYLRTRQLWLPIGLHIGWNFFEGPVFGFQVSGLTDLPRLLIHTVDGPEMFTGGAFGPEAGLVIIPAMALGALAITWYSRGRLSDNHSNTDTQT
jgi:hypothetical protein